MYQLLNRYQSEFSTHILLYHSTYRSIPGNLRNGLHNVEPDTLFKQIQWYKKYFDIVNLDDLFDNQTNSFGKVAITFDDAYDSVFSEAIPVLESLNAPCTIYINGASLYGKPFWRDKIRYLINNDLVESFLMCNPDLVFNHSISKNNFYRKTKSKYVNSKDCDILLDEFFNERKISIDDVKFCVQDMIGLKKNRLVTYGNHAYSHYVLSSLTRSQQEYEIYKNQELLESLDVNFSKIFAIPFGGTDDFNKTTIDLLKKYNYKAFLSSNNRINLVPVNKVSISNAHSLLSGERFMVEPRHNLFQKQLFKLGIKSLLSHYILFP